MSILRDLFIAIVKETRPPTARPDVVHMPDGTTRFLVHEGYTVEDGIGPRQGKRLHVFSDLESFAAWLVREADGLLPDCIDVALRTDEREQLAVAAVRNGRMRGGDADRIAAGVALHPRMARWRGVFDKTLSQRQLHQLLVAAARDDVVGEVGAGVPMYEYLLAKIGQFSTIKDGGYESNIDERGVYQLRATREGVTVSGAVPSRFTISAPLYVGLDHDPSLEVLLRIDIDEKSVPWFVLTAPNWPVVLHEGLLVGKRRLEELMPSFLIGLGSLQVHDATVTR